jgi:ketosteroid isomerase-like protein
MDDDRVRELVTAFAAAELSGDPEVIGPLLTDDFVGVGPLGFLLSRQDWIDRRANGLRYTAFAVRDLHVRTYGDDTAVVIGTQVVQGTHRGNPVPAQTRATMVFAGPLLAGIQMAFVAGTPGAPPIPGPPR